MFRKILISLKKGRLAWFGVLHGFFSSDSSDDHNFIKNRDEEYMYIPSQICEEFSEILFVKLFHLV